MASLTADTRLRGTRKNKCWTESETEKLIEAARLYGRDYAKIQKHFEHTKSIKEIRRKFRNSIEWMHSLGIDVKLTPRKTLRLKSETVTFTEEEHACFVKTVREVGKDICEIAKRITSKSHSEIKQYIQ